MILTVILLHSAQGTFWNIKMNVKVDVKLPSSNMVKGAEAKM